MCLLFGIKHDTAFVYCKSIFAWIDFIFLSSLSYSSWAIMLSAWNKLYVGLLILVSREVMILYYLCWGCMIYFTIKAFYSLIMICTCCSFCCMAAGNSIPWSSVDKYYPPENTFYKSNLAVYFQKKRAEKKTPKGDIE